MDLQHHDPDLFGYRPTPTPPANIYPTAPGFKGERDGPSHQAAQAIAPTVRGLRKKTLDAFKTFGPMTADAAAIRMQRTPFSIRPRVSELHKLGFLEPAPARAKGDSGMTVHVWTLTEAGRHA